MFEDVVDIHMHVGLLGDSEEFKPYGFTDGDFRKSLTYDLFLFFAGLERSELSDANLHKAAVKTITGSKVEKVVCLGLDKVYDENGALKKTDSKFWVANEYLYKLANDTGGKALPGVSVHPYAPDFEERVTECVANGAVLLKWLPSAQQINLAHPKVLKALKFMAKAKNGNPLPLLLHTGPEYAIPTADKRCKSYDFISWKIKDALSNLLHNWHVPDVQGIHHNFNEALKANAQIIFAHCGLPYFPEVPFDHSDFDAVAGMLVANKTNGYPGKCFADVSALCTPVRKLYFDEIRKLPPEYLLFGGDYPTPAFEINADLKENLDDLNAIAHGNLKRLIVPQGNLIDVNYNVLSQFFPGHLMFTNFKKHFLS